MEEQIEFDLFVIGGGSGGIAAASAASSFGAKVGLADFVKPSWQGTQWGLGGTCVNVGCIPKKLFHHASLLGELKQDLKESGWNIDPTAELSWSLLSKKITNYIKSLNFRYRAVKLPNQNITYYNKLARLITNHQVELTDAQGNTERIKAKNILIATGGRPTNPHIPGGVEHGINSDDIFWMKESPGKTLIVGASYIALECGGFLHGLGLDVTIMVRSILLRGFDQHLAQKIGDSMKQSKIKFIEKAVPLSIALNLEGKKIVKFQKGEDQFEQTYDTVLFAIGRSADTKGLNLEGVGVKTASNGKIIADDFDKTSIENIYSIGDVCYGRIELTPTAIMAGKLLAARLFNKSTRQMSYKFVPTTVFTPLQYGTCGYSEEDAQEHYGKENIVAYGSQYKPVEWALNQKRTTNCYAKLVVNKAEDNKIVGFHFLGPNAGEVTQGFSIAILKGITKSDLDYSVGIHPTLAEQFTLMKAIARTPQEIKAEC